MGKDPHRGRSPGSTSNKEVAWRTADMGWIETVRFGETMRKVAVATEDVAEGLRAWQEKRKPDWQGR